MIIKRAFNNIFWLFLSEACSRGLIFLGTIYLARVLGKAGFGLYSLALAVGVYFWIVVDMGVMVYGTREIARNKEKAAELYSLLNSLRFILAVTLFLIFCAVLYMVDMTPEKRLILIAGGFYVVGYSLSPDWVFRGLEKMQYIALGSIVTSFFFITGIYLLVKAPSDTFWLPLSTHPLSY
jgi:PST family polysaccharide transporter